MVTVSVGREGTDVCVDGECGAGGDGRVCGRWVWGGRGRTCVLTVGVGRERTDVCVDGGCGAGGDGHVC